MAFKLNRITESDFFEANKLLKKNYKPFLHTQISSSELLTALEKDKKNTSDELRLILPNKNGDIEISFQKKGSTINNSVEKYLKEIL